MFRNPHRCLASIVVLSTLISCNLATGQDVAYDLIEGFTQPYKVINVASPESGILVQLDVEEGDRVAAEQVLGALNSEVHQAMLNIAQAAMEAHGRLDSAKAEVDLREDRLDKLFVLETRGGPVGCRIDVQRATVKYSIGVEITIVEARPDAPVLQRAVLRDVRR